MFPSWIAHASARPYKMWFYPVPIVIAFFGWAYVFLASGWLYIKIGLLTLLTGALVFFIWAKWKGIGLRLFSFRRGLRILSR